MISARLLAAVCACSALNAEAQTRQTCVDVQVGTAQSYDCLNQSLQAASQRAHQASAGTQVYDANSPSNVTGQFNEAATRERLGRNFGKSVTPQRPNNVFTAPVAVPH